MTEDEMVGWHQRLNGQEFEQTPGDSEGQENLAHCSSWAHKQSDMTWALNNKISVCKYSFIDVLIWHQSPTLDCMLHKDKDLLFAQ